MFEMFNSFLQNPLMYFMKSKFKIPNNINDPNEMINHLMRTGQLTQDQYNQVQAQFRNLQASGQLPKQPNQ